jgi:hypothetical protein
VKETRIDNQSHQEGDDDYEKEDADAADDDDDSEIGSDEDGGREKRKISKHPPRLNEESIHSVSNYAQV